MFAVNPKDACMQKLDSYVQPFGKSMGVSN